MKVNPIHGKGREVYHNNKDCTERNNLEKKNIVQGTGGKRLCHRCRELNKK